VELRDTFIIRKAEGAISVSGFLFVSKGTPLSATVPRLTGSGYFGKLIGHRDSGAY